jgi:hypothetical protein
MKHPERETSLDAGDLILVEFHRVDFAAPVSVIPGIGAKDACEQYAGAASERMDWLISFRHAILLIGLLKNDPLLRFPDPSPFNVPKSTPHGSGLRGPCIRPFLNSPLIGPSFDHGSAR